MVLDLYHEVLQDAFSGCGPLQWCGSILLELYEGKGDIHQFEMYRDILLADVIGKIAKQYARNLVLPHLNSYLLDTMCGASSEEKLTLARIFLGPCFPSVRVGVFHLAYFLLTYVVLLQL